MLAQDFLGISPADCVWIWGNSQCYCREMALDPKAGRAAPAADAEESFRSRGEKQGGWLTDFCLLSSFVSLVAFPYIKFQM